LYWRLANCAKRRPLEVGADVVGGHAAQHGFDAVAVAVVDEACNDTADDVGHHGQAVPGIPAWV